MGLYRTPWTAEDDDTLMHADKEAVAQIIKKRGSKAVEHRINWLDN